jgi:hypothetical protein
MPSCSLSMAWQESSAVRAVRGDSFPSERISYSQKLGNSKIVGRIKRASSGSDAARRAG